ncbi:MULTISPECIES: hypothetical protein [Kitasatospora]|uniref:Uncharacterized protein n=1 Tax=Kitasatospora cathayae TaxID=3004092 RepID=A0ABY7QDI7_9ACTN|nr:hypothetical protein [Kitasatospora sp. HUAS 3-15]WBP90824.1 hypothetical protein O1G21_36485 [Kitasatospora sp. HUAS 3-15]
MRRTHPRRAVLAACPALAAGPLLSAAPAQGRQPIPDTQIACG